MDYFLRTARLGFRHWRDDDIQLAQGLWGDAQVSRLIGGPFTAEQVRERLAREVAMQREHGVQYWPIFLLAQGASEGAHVGCCGLRPYERIYELGFHICSLYWRRGYALEAARAVMDYAFTSLGAKALFAGHNPKNEPSRRLLAQLGFKYVRDEFYPPTGLNHPSYLAQAPEASKRGR